MSPLEVEHARLVEQGWWLAPDGCYRKKGAFFATGSNPMIPDWRDGNCGLCPIKMVDIGQKYRERAISLCNGKCVKWSAGIEYDEGRCGRSAVYGLKSREEAVAWLERAFNWKLCWFLSPSVWIRGDST